MALELEKMFREKVPEVEVLLSRRSFDGSVQFDAVGIEASAARCRLWSTPDYGRPVDLMLSIHNNASGTGTAYGYGVIHSVAQPSALAFVLAEELDRIGRPRHAIFSREYMGAIFASVSGQQKADTREVDFFGIIRGTISNATTSVIVESVFVDNQAEVEQWIFDPGNGAYRMDKIRELMSAVFRAIVSFFKITTKPEATPEPEPLKPEPTTEPKPVKPEPKPVEPVPQPGRVPGMRKISVTYDRTEGKVDIYEVAIDGHITMVEVPWE